MSGFVGRHLLNYLAKMQDLWVLGIDLDELVCSKDVLPKNYEFSCHDMLNKSELSAIIKKFRPDGIIHLASLSSVGYSWKHPIDCFNNNTNIFLNLLESIRQHNKDCRLLSVGSSEEYGNFDMSDLPLSEDRPTFPTSPYGVARASQEMLSRVYVSGYNLDIVITRSFNHIGPGQDNRFFIPGIASQLTEIKNKHDQKSSLVPVIRVGNLSLIRDFTDVRDVVKAYWLLLQKGGKGEIYNVCSEKGHKLANLCQKMKVMAGMEAVFETDPEMIRPVENEAIIGSNNKIFERTGWRPLISIEKSLKDVLTYWELQSQT